MKVSGNLNPDTLVQSIKISSENRMERDFIEMLMNILREGDGSVILYDGHSKQTASYEHGFGVSLT